MNMNFVVFNARGGRGRSETGSVLNYGVSTHALISNEAWKTIHLKEMVLPQNCGKEKYISEYGICMYYIYIF
jgi:hypothetical protein